ncbi:helicase-associated domain-containing protein [Microbacterium telephonicum]|uniref:XPB/Ssl2-like helicase family protein n=1 Tax=Microbacterium telephonicum TaxID=1714841 RepID=A0A498BWN9_9MICO|nr:helicase-associated domain-containing protein [Microbacterium telephonicum]RLK47387.1 XPB/Ssl2-like helicase family protein [Microbacterium telephonicum]
MAASDARALAEQLAAADDAALTRLFTLRRVPASAPWPDFFDAAEALLEPASLTRHLSRLSAAEADALTAASASGRPVTEPARGDLAAAGLLDADGRPFASVLDAFAALPRVTATTTTDATAPAHPDAVGTAAGNTPAEDPAAESDAHAAERAFAASASLADILQTALTAPLARIGSGALGAADRRRLVETGAADDADAADDLLGIAVTAGLAAAADRLWLVTPAGRDWLASATLTRWHDVARRLREALPAALRSPDGGWIPAEDWTAAFPYDPLWPPQAARLRALFRRWALLGDGDRPAGFAAALSRGADADLEALGALLPPEVDRVFLQNDLTAIAPGPLLPALDLRLRAMSRRESRAQASSYRFTSETLNAALNAGESAQSLREFLTALSLTGLPQPLAYEIDRAAARHGTIRVGPGEAGGARVASADPDLLRTIAVDQALRPLGLRFEGDELASRAGSETTFWMLADARYPVVAVDGDGARLTLDRHRLADDDGPSQVSVDHGPLIARLQAAQQQDTGAGWLGRELELAVRSRATIVVTVQLPDGSQREFTVEAAGMGGGRLRGRDRAADVERTLPVSSITGLRPA